MRWRVFITWSIVLGLLCLFANWPHSVSLANFLEVAGFPLVFAFWVGGRLETFNSGALAIDALLGIAATFGLAFLCAWSRGKVVDPRPI
jgi:hypothetical protein